MDENIDLSKIQFQNQDHEEDALDYLHKDHLKVEQLFEKYKRTSTDAYSMKASLIRQFIKEVSMHSDMEEKVFYPFVRKELSNGFILHPRSTKEHLQIKKLLSQMESRLSELEKYSFGNSSSTEEPITVWFDIQFANVMRELLYHMREEEQEIFVQLKATVPKHKLVSLKVSLELAKISAASHPHRLYFVFLSFFQNFTIFQKQKWLINLL